jgi:hypothetical protein
LGGLLLLVPGAAGAGDRQGHHLVVVGPPEEVVPEGPDVGQGLDGAVDVVSLVQVVEADEAGKVPASEQVPGEADVRVQRGDLVLPVGRVEGGRDVRQGRVPDLVVVGEAVEGPPREVDVNEVSLVDGVGVGGGLPPPAPEELAANEATVDVGARLE